jgi:hypothetical protein
MHQGPNNNLDFVTCEHYLYMLIIFCHLSWTGVTLVGITANAKVLLHVVRIRKDLLMDGQLHSNDHVKKRGS